MTTTGGADVVGPTGPDDPHNRNTTANAGTADLVASEGDHLPERFPNPGLPPHRYRTTDFDPQAAKRAERQVTALFLLSVVGSIIFCVAYFAIPLEGNFQNIQYSTLFLGLGLGLAIFAIGIGAVHWAKTLMPDHEVSEERHYIGDEQSRTDAMTIINEGLEESGIGRRTVIRNSLIGAAAIAPIPVVLSLGDLGPLPGDALTTTLWDEGTRLTRDPDGTPIRAQDVQIGSVFHVIPEGLEESEHPLEEKAKAVVLLIRVEPGVVEYREDREGWDVDGIYAYSKICTHVGCPVALYEQVTHHLLCPCHQSTFDFAKHCEVIFGPAKRPLPQLPIRVDDEGYLVAQRGFEEPVGPSFWERGEA
ncbi:MAG: Ubiquinol-cytochrome C reductase iron-sulfur subunit [uncultured Quadrisphaera sp.]|uniref:Cytochrome bc1 complex Rieske iron-sulfur subunit n=1 Tax=uncultured Quadrisphaera sp. TaxID=904978 RepID=A0A6J4Q1C6_9ACTN|nr:MAG: Ubiquinol-cytochrome C reductase iron-sulfur subunit [uncultured Quadrisphaera sp.]